MTEPKSDIEMPPLLEQMGALGSLLIHDMANQMCIISGNATFAQMMLGDPQQVSRAVEAIAKSGERISFILGQCAELRRRIAGELPHGMGPETAEQLRELFRSRPEWKAEIAEGLEGGLYVPTRWIVFAVQQVLEVIDSPSGSVRVRRIRPDEDTAFLPGGSYFEIRLQWRSPRAFVIDELRAQYEAFGLLAAFELVRQCGGKLEGFTPAPEHQEILICVPFVFEIGKRETGE